MKTSLPAVLALLLPVGVVAQRGTEPAQPVQPLSYIVSHATAAPVIDGRIDDEAWRTAPWSSAFVDIEGAVQPPPPLRTRVRMLWDDSFLYIAAELEEPHVWATLTQRDAVIFYDHDFEVFIDPDGDTHEYFELELNALATVWDLMLTRPYRDGGRAIDHWDMGGMRAAVHVDGTLNDARDRDRGWSVELALPWDALSETAAHTGPPQPGEQWRINFSRVEWDVDTVSGGYRKRLNAQGQPLPEHNWVWSPQGEINMHMPEAWGVIQFAAGAAAQDTLRPDGDAAMRQALRELYYAQRRYQRVHGSYATALSALGVAVPEGAALHGSASAYEITVTAASGVTLHVRDDGREWRSGGSAR